MAYEAPEYEVVMEGAEEWEADPLNVAFKEQVEALKARYERRMEGSALRDPDEHRQFQREFADLSACFLPALSRRYALSVRQTFVVKRRAAR